MDMKTSELREYPRLEQEFTVYFDVVPKRETAPLAKPQRKGLAKNISGGGLYLVTSKLRKGIIKNLLDHLCKLTIEFYLPDFQNKIRVLGEVRWVKEKLHWWDIYPKTRELGVRFVYIQPEDKDSIIKYVINKEIEEHLTKSR